MTIRIDPLGFTKNFGGGHTSRSMMFREMLALVQAMPVDATKHDFQVAIVDENVLAKRTMSSRIKSLRHLIDLYGLDITRPLFRVLWNWAHVDLDSLAQLCLVSAYARDAELRQSFAFIQGLRPGESLKRTMLEQHFECVHPGRFSAAMKKSLAQNVSTSWTVAGHLTGRTGKIRSLPEPRPISAAYAMFVGYLSGLRGEQLLDSDFAALVSSNRDQLLSALSLASARGLLSLKRAANIVEFDFNRLLSPMEQALVHESY